LTGSAGRRQSPADFLVGVGDALRAQRLKASLSMRELAGLAEVSQPFLSQVENGHTTPSLATLYRLAAAMNISPGDLMPQPESNDVIVTRADDGAMVPTSDHPRSAIGRVIASGAGRGLEFIEYRVDPAEHLDAWFEFDGELVVYVVEGRLEVEIENRGTWLLKAKEAIHHQAAIRHRWRPVGKKPVFLLFAAVRH
jgi:transcriptional regulator with XRE-family HTH domain